ncbi:GDSL esterase/lipase At3g27950 isoform X2 [Coffea eugenioides]|uniref:GDSL esterase/lipase At3g27950 isoform X2 n=1 Tax=Coffea eugenioides TaxID=49369 RepID=UPI000F6057E5|nr:GDSL esterase/lipase At3g27950 isoform X2 [Coffea eugenioides]
MEFRKLILMLNILGLMANGEIGGARDVDRVDRQEIKSCKFPALYNFGDSNSDTGGRSASLDMVAPPNGETFFKAPSGRFCDGRLIIDFMAEELGLPYLSAYLDSIGSNFRHGANFATGGSSIRPGGYSPFHLQLQIGQFLQFKSRTTLLYKQLNHSAKSPPLQSRLPRPQDFSDALYTFDIGQNDLAYGFEHTSEAETRESIPSMLDKLGEAIHQLYKAGARNFWVHNTGPIGCLPYSVIYYLPKPRNLDGKGCVEPQNKVAQEFNEQLRRKVLQLRAQLPAAALTYVDMYSAKYSLISNAKKLGFEDPSQFCCGSYYGYHIGCGEKAIVNGTVYGNPCPNPSEHISWDGIHYSEAANALLAKTVLDGSLADPKVSVGEACHSSMT